MDLPGAFVEEKKVIELPTEEVTPIKEEDEETLIEKSFNCDFCPSSGTSACEECLVYFCELHQNAHRMTRQNHSIVSHDHLSRKIVEMIDASHLYVKYARECNTHKSHTLNKFCIECQSLCCSECAFSGDHDGHVIRMARDWSRKTWPQFKEQVVPETKSNYEQLSQMKVKVLDSKDNLLAIHQKTLKELEEEYECMKVELDLQFESQKKLLESAYASTRSLLADKEVNLAMRIMSCKRLLERYDKIQETDDVYEFPMIQNELKELLSEIGKPSEADIKPPLSNEPQYQLLKKTIVQKDLQMISKYESVVDSNPFRSATVKPNTPELSVEFKFPRATFDLGLEYKLPTLTFAYKWSCKLCKIPIEFVYDPAETVIDGLSMTVHGQMKSKCAHQWKWKKNGNSSTIYFSFVGKEYEFEIPFDLFQQRLD